MGGEPQISVVFELDEDKCAKNTGRYPVGSSREEALAMASDSPNSALERVARALGMRLEVRIA